MTGQSATTEAAVTESGAAQQAQPQAGQPQQTGQQSQQPQVDWSVTGFNNPDEVLAAINALKSENEGFKAAAAVSPFANPLMKSLNQLAAEGRDTGALINYLTLQGQDFDNMSSEDAIKWQKKMAMPRWNQQDVNDWFSEKYAMPDPDDEDRPRKERMRQLNLDEAAESARKELNQLKADAGKPDEAKLQREAAMQQRQKDVALIANNVLNGLKEMNFSHKFKGVDGAEMEYNLPFVPKLRNDQRDFIINSVANSYAGRSDFQLNAEGQQKIEDNIKFLTKALLFDEIFKAQAEDSYFSTYQNTIKQISNVQ